MACEQCLMVRLSYDCCELEGCLGLLALGGNGFAGNSLLSPCDSWIGAILAVSNFGLVSSHSFLGFLYQVSKQFRR